MSNKKVLSYGDVLLRQSDVDLLTGPYWLNDQIISFYFEYLTRTAYLSLGNRISLLSGCTTFLLIHGSESDVRDSAESLQIAQKELILFAVNDNPYLEEANSGSHWTLLAYAAAERTFYHFDSLSSQANEAAAREAQTKLHSVLGKDTKFVTPSVPRQNNAYDCGMHVLATAGTLCQAMQQQRTIADQQTEQLWPHCQPAAVKKLRSNLLDIIKSLIHASK